MADGEHRHDEHEHSGDDPRCGRGRCGAGSARWRRSRTSRLLRQAGFRRRAGPPSQRPYPVPKLPRTRRCPPSRPRPARGFGRRRRSTCRLSPQALSGFRARRDPLSRASGVVYALRAGKLLRIVQFSDERRHGRRFRLDLRPFELGGLSGDVCGVPICVDGILAAFRLAALALRGLGAAWIGPRRRLPLRGGAFPLRQGRRGLPFRVLHRAGVQQVGLFRRDHLRRIPALIGRLPRGAACASAPRSRWPSC